MSAQHTTRHNLEQYKKQAKGLLNAYRSGEVQAVALVGQHLPRLGKIGAVEGKISLQEAQHVIACQHEFKDWNWLHAVAVLDLYLLIGCQDRDLVVLLRESDGRDIVYALSRTSEDLRERFLSCVSERLQGFLREEMSFLEELSDEQVADAQRRILLHAAALDAQGQLTWPQSRSAPPRRHPLAGRRRCRASGARGYHSDGRRY